MLRFAWHSLCGLAVSLALALAGCSDLTVAATDDVAAGPGDAMALCALGKTACGELCVDLRQDPANCGACGKACASGEVCSAGSCAPFCAEPLIDCAGLCVDLRSDKANCGTCGNGCPSTEVCAQGECKLTCAAGYSKCGGKCVALDGDPGHCGGCGKACASGEVCAEGACIASCPSGLSQCNGTCVDLLADERNCGGCGKECGSGDVCSQGKCAPSCQSGLSDCGGACVDTQTSLLHCGGCGNACAPGQKCSAGQCALDCQVGLSDCASTCVDTQSNALHCGGCGSACPAGYSCGGGTCQIACQLGLSACGTVCVDNQSDEQHCGGCGVACQNGEACIGAACVLDCPIGLSGCASSCVDVQSDEKHCGGCGIGCAAGESCESGVCLPACQQGQTLCGQLCTSTATDPMNCGGCNMPCLPGHVCSSGQCALSCQAGLTECKGSCTNLQSDSAHCGKCGESCGDGKMCVQGVCVPSCKAPLIACGDQCVDPNFDPKHCGGCGQVCAAANGSPACVDATCQVYACNEGFANCDAQPANGCEVELKSNGLNCGACGKTCNLYKALPNCENGACKVVQCEAGWGDCNGVGDDGCEANLLTDRDNCGACGLPVAATESCCGGKPVATLSYATDVENCGTCGIQCKQGQTCCAGLCYDQDSPKICTECGKLCAAKVVTGNAFATSGSVSRLEASGGGISTISNADGKNKATTPRVWIATHDSNLINRLDTGTGKLMSVFPSFGTFPSRGAVALDETYWIGNRCPDDPNNPNCSNVVQLRSDGTQGCLVGKAADGGPLPFVRAIGMDADGYVWLGTWNDRRVHKIDPLTCKTVADYTLPVNGNPYGFAIDSKGVLWVSSPTNGSLFYGVDTKTGAIKHSVSRTGQSYGVTVDGNDNVWMAVWCANQLHRIDAVTKTASKVSIGFDGTWCARGMAVDTDGNVWAATARWDNNPCATASYVQKFEKGSGKLLGSYAVGNGFGGGALGISQDANGKIWVTSTCTHKVARINKDTGATELVAPLYGVNPYTYSDWTGGMLKNVTTKNGQMGVWVANFDGGGAATTWQQATFDATKPAGTNVRVRFRAAETIETIEAAPWCVPASSASPVDLKGCNFGQKRWLQAEVYLLTSNVDIRPKVDNFKVYWQL